MEEDVEDGAGSGDQLAHLFVFSNAKSGMGGVDQSHVNQVIYEESKNSAFLKNALTKDQKNDAMIQQLKDKLALANNVALHPLAERTRIKAEELRSKFDSSRIFAVVDVDSFFVSVEIRDNPSLKDKPVAVGGIGMISTSNYIARQYGVRSAMPGFIAKKLCPELVLVKSNFDKYREASRKIMDVLRKYDPNLSCGSLDEAYMDLTDYVDAKIGIEKPEDQRMNFACAIVRKMRREVFEATQLTVSAGVARNRMVAKICSDVNKPNGQFEVKGGLKELQEFLFPLSTRKVPGIGKVMQKVLDQVLGVQTVHDLWEKRVLCAFLFSPKTAEWFLRVCLCCSKKRSTAQGDESELKRKSISTERTFKGKDDKAELLSICRTLCNELAAASIKQGVVGRCLTLKLKYVDYTVKTRQTTFNCAVPKENDLDEENSTHAGGSELFEIVKPLFLALMPCKLRLVGVRLSHLEAAGEKKVSAQAGGALAQAFAHAAVRQQDLKRGVNEHLGQDGEQAQTRKKARAASLVHCPICNQQFDLSEISNEKLNLHIDRCLGQKGPSPPLGRSKKKSSIRDFLHARGKSDKRNPLK